AIAGVVAEEAVEREKSRSVGTRSQGRAVEVLRPSSSDGLGMTARICGEWSGNEIHASRCAEGEPRQGYSRRTRHRGNRRWLDGAAWRWPGRFSDGGCFSG